MSNTPNIDKLVSSIAEDLREIVADTEASIATTRNHYGDYLTIITQLSKGNKAAAGVISLALKEAGANHQGVNDALRVSF